MRYAVKYRTSDGGVVDYWSGPDEVPVHDHRGHPALEGEAKRSAREVALDVLGVRRARRWRHRTTSPIELLHGNGQAALEIDEPTFQRLGPVTRPDGRLSWMVVDGALVPVGDRPIYATGPVTPSSEPIRGELTVRIPGLTT